MNIMTAKKLVFALVICATCTLVHLCGLRALENVVCWAFGIVGADIIGWWASTPGPNKHDLTG
ncbi:hypothetical protein [Actinomyces procaprae]|uniref:hypothetical protein n=1 Tax=Actinomyces procaprae TaxID=2560010 RepID=UPI00109DA765|nr:hypothetical protein [Actinomyces procaprae]